MMFTLELPTTLMSFVALLECQHFISPLTVSLKPFDSPPLPAVHGND